MGWTSYPPGSLVGQNAHPTIELSSAVTPISCVERLAQRFWQNLPLQHLLWNKTLRLVSDESNSPLFLP